MMLCDYCRSIPSRTAKKKTWQMYGESEQICAPEPDSNAADCPELDSNAADRATQSDFFTPAVTAGRPDIKMTPLKVEDEGWLLIDVVNKNYVPVTDLNSEEFKHQETPVKFRIKNRVL